MSRIGFREGFVCPQRNNRQTYLLSQGKGGMYRFLRLLETSQNTKKFFPLGSFGRGTGRGARPGRTEGGNGERLWERDDDERSKPQSIVQSPLPRNRQRITFNLEEQTVTSFDSGFLPVLGEIQCVGSRDRRRLCGPPGQCLRPCVLGTNLSLCRPVPVRGSQSLKTLWSIKTTRRSKPVLSRSGRGIR